MLETDIPSVAFIPSHLPRSWNDVDCSRILPKSQSHLTGLGSTSYPNGLYDQNVDYEAAVDSFIAVAGEYCDWLEAPPLSMAQEHFAATGLVARLYASAIQLPNVGPDYLPLIPQVPALTRFQEEAVRLRLRSFPFQHYWEVFHTLTTEAEEPCLGDITDDLGDVYRDVKEGMLALELSGRHLAVWHWRSTFSVHWGRHASSALRALHEFELPDSES